MTHNLGADIEREPDLIDRGSVRAEEITADALEAHRLADPNYGKTVDDSAEECAVCGYPIPQARREAVPGVQTCAECQRELERELERAKRLRGR